MCLREARTEIVVALGYALLPCAVSASVLQPEGSHAVETPPACEALEKHKRFKVFFQHVEIEKLILVEAVSKTPILGDIPLFGNLFRNTTKKKAKVNLLLFLTPHIIRTRADFESISERKRQERQKLLEQFWG
jgi:Bacterial type II and III secretion system protein